MLRNGRKCSNPSHCISMNCEDGTCTGKTDKQSCSSHEDCHAGMFCSRNPEYPFTSSCKNFKTSYEQCTETEECQHNFYCWYADINDSPLFGENPEMKCLPLYSQPVGTKFGWDQKDFSKDPTFEDFELNGKYCKSGLAMYNPEFKGAQCTEAIKVMQGDKELKEEENF